METAPITAWTLSHEIPIPPDVEPLLVQGEQDWNSELELWTRAGHIKVKLAKGADVRRLDSLIAWAVLKV